MPSPSSSKKKEPETKKPAAKEGQTEIVVAAAAPAVTAADAAAAASKSRNEDAAMSTQPPPKKKRMCRFPGCDKVIKSQGSCQKHGAKAKRCRVEGCDKQAQGTHDGMCKRHWKEANAPAEPAANKEENTPEPEGVSVYDHIIPQSIAFRPHHAISAGPKTTNDSAPDQLQHHPAAAAAFATAVGATNGQGSPSEDTTPVMMPLVAFLSANAGKPAGWHREEERRARGIRPVPALSCQLESWERQLALVEILLLSGGTPHANFKDLAHAWGREKGFHHVLTNLVCERRGEVERKRRSDVGKMLSPGQRAVFKEKLLKTRGKQSNNGNNSNNGSDNAASRSKESSDESVAKVAAAEAVSEARAASMEKVAAAVPKDSVPSAAV